MPTRVTWGASRARSSRIRVALVPSSSVRVRRCRGCEVPPTVRDWRAARLALGPKRAGGVVGNVGVPPGCGRVVA